MAGCRYFTGPAVRLARDGYAGLAEILEIPCDTEIDRPEAHLEEPETHLTPEVIRRLREAAPDAVVMPPGQVTHQAGCAEVGLTAEQLVPIHMEPLCLVGADLREPAGPVALLLRPALVSPLLVAALSGEASRYVYLPIVSVDHLRTQLAVAKRARLSVVLTEPAAVPLATASGFVAHSVFAPPRDCLVVHALERALARAALSRLPRQTHVPVSAAVPETAGPSSMPLSVPEGTQTAETVALRTRKRFVLIPQTAITYATSLGGVTTAYTDAGRLWTDQTLSAFERRLDPRRFLRLDQSHVVNLMRVAELIPWTHQRYRLVFADAVKTELVLSRDVGRRLRALLGW